MKNRKDNTFDELPEWAKTDICVIWPNDTETWITRPVPALKNQSVLTVMNQGESGEDRVREYLLQIKGKFGFP